MMRTAMAIGGAWAFLLLVHLLFETNWPWFTMICVNMVAAWIVLNHPAGIVQALIGSLYLVQIAMLAGYGWAHMEGGYDHSRAVLCWEWSSIIGFIKLALLGVWSGGELFRINDRRRRDVRAWKAYPDGARR